MKENKPAVSIVIAAYKGEKYIGELLMSLFRQTYSPDEILIGDDSPDNLTEQAINDVLSYAPDSVRIDYCKNQQRYGVVRNFSQLAERAAGDYIFFCDQDDIWLENKVKIMVETLIRNPDYELAACDSMRVTADLQPMKRMVNPKCLDDRKEKFFRNIWNMSGTFSAHNLVMRNCRNGCLPFPPDFREYHDRWMVLFYGIRNKIIYTDQVLTLYRIHGENLSMTKGHGYTRNLLERFYEIRQQADHDIKTTLELYLQYRDLLLKRIPQEQIPEENLTYMNGSISYFLWRVENRKSRFFLLRILRSLFHISDYFKYSNGLKSFIRDCFF